MNTCVGASLKVVLKNEAALLYHVHLLYLHHYVRATASIILPCIYWASRWFIFVLCGSDSSVNSIRRVVCSLIQVLAMLEKITHHKVPVVRTPSLQQECGAAC